MRIIKLSEEACRALEQFGVAFETIGVVPPQSDTATPVKPPQQADRPPQRLGVGKETGERYNAKATGAENRREYLRRLGQQSTILLCLCI